MKSFGLIVASCLGTIVSASSDSSPPSSSLPSSSLESINVPAAGATSSSSGNGGNYASLCESVKCEILEKVSSQIDDMRRSIIEEGSCIPTFGVRSDTLCNQAIEEFASNAPSPADDALSASIYDQKLEELESAIDAPLQVLYLRQLALIREKALQKYHAAAKTTEASNYEAMITSDSLFTQEAEEATREGSDWDYAAERTHMQTVMNDLASSGKKLVDVQLKSAQQQSTAMQYLQQQQQMIQQLQMQLYGQTSPWNIGVAYRIPDTNFNLNGSYQQGRANLQLSCVPDEYAPMLGANGFTNGVGPGNLGLSVNLSV